MNKKSMIFDNETIKIEVVDNPHPDVFKIYTKENNITIKRIDQDLGWGQNLMLKIHRKSDGITRTIEVGPSRHNSKTIEMPTWHYKVSTSAFPKALVIIAGESFRCGQSGRVRDTDESFPPQMKASMSHNKLFDSLKNKHGIDCDIVLSSYATKYQSSLIEWYGSRLIAHSFRNQLVGLERLVIDALVEIDVKNYEFIFVSRVDIEYKNYFIQIFDPSWNKIMFPSICWAFQGYMSTAPAWVPRISDTMEFVPKRLMGVAKKAFHLRHEAWHQYRIDGLQESDIGFMLNTFHDSDSAKDYNPLYRMASRRDSKKFHSPNLMVGKDRSPVRCFSYIGFPDWKQPVTREYEDDEVVISYKYDHHIRPEQFSISLDSSSREIVIKRIDINQGWNHNVILMVKEKNNGKEREIFAGKSSSNELKISLDYRSDFYEDENFEISVRPHQYPDAFHIERVDDKNLAVTRLDESGGWGQSLCLIAKNKFTGFKKSIRVGDSNQNKKLVSAILNWNPNSKSVRVALCLCGAISRINGSSPIRGMIYDAKEGRIDYRAVAKSIDAHILMPNKEFKIDTFIHSWNFDLAADLESLYCPVISLFEDNEMYSDEIEERCQNKNDFSGISQALSIKRVIQIKEQYERDKGLNYDMVVIYRPDVLLWKDMLFKKYDVSSGVFVNSHDGFNGDFHFVMSSDDSKSFKGLYDSALKGNSHTRHQWIKNFIEAHMKSNILMDDIMPGRDQEIARPHKIMAGPVGVHKIKIDLFLKYGIARETLM